MLSLVSSKEPKDEHFPTYAYFWHYDILDSFRYNTKPKGRYHFRLLQKNPKDTHFLTYDSFGMNYLMLKSLQHLSTNLL